MTQDSAPPTRWALFSAFVKIGVIGFGGVAAIARHVLVVERGMMSDVDFAESFGVASTLPGANTVNLASMLGDRWIGPTGAMAAVAGLMGPPVVILVGLMTIYARFAQDPDVGAGVSAAAAAAAGLVIGTSLKLLVALRPNVMNFVIFAGVCLAAAALRLPMPLIILVAIPMSLILAFAPRRRA